MRITNTEKERQGWGETILSEVTQIFNKKVSKENITETSNNTPLAQNLQRNRQNTLD